MSSKLDCDTFQDNTNYKKLHILKVQESHLGSVSLPKFTSELPSCDNCGGPFSCEQDYLLCGQFWAMGRLSYMGCKVIY